MRCSGEYKYKFLPTPESLAGRIVRAYLIDRVLAVFLGPTERLEGLRLVIAAVDLGRGDFAALGLL